MTSRMIRLLTFSQLPEPERHDCSLFFDELSARMVRFENHYLQRPDSTCPIEALGGELGFAGVAAALQENNRTAAALSVSCGGGGQ